MNFKIKSLDHFLPSFLSKNSNSKTQDFRPLIKRVLAGVSTVSSLEDSSKNFFEVLFSIKISSIVVLMNSKLRPKFSHVPEIDAQQAHVH